MQTNLGRGLLLACAWLCCVKATQVANFNVTRAQAEAHDCGTECQRRLNLTIPADVEVIGLDFDVDFFATASNFSQETAEPGQVLKLQPIDPKSLDIDGGATAFRFQYTSVDFDGSVVPVTGFIAFPFTPHASPETENSDRYRLAAFAHGTIGIFAGCAPSNGPLLYDYGTWQPALKRGYAIVATDYAGLGNNFTTHKYLSAPAQANDVYYSVLAARKLFGSSLTDEWVSFGHSQGGGAVWKLAESKLVRDDPSYLGTVAIAPSTYFITQVKKEITKSASSPNATKSGGAGFFALFPESARRVIPSYNETILSPVLRSRMQLATEAQWCLEAVLGVSLDLGAKELLSVEGAIKDLPILQKWQDMVTPAQGDLSPAPILIIQGQNDTAVNWETTVSAWENSCKAGNEVHLRIFPSQGHRPSLSAGASEWLMWMDQRFERSGTQACRNKTCTKYMRHPFNLAYVRAPTDIELKPYLG